MNLNYTEQHNQFRHEIRQWLQQHVPKEPLASFDTAEGFEAHRTWERLLFSGRWSTVNWPTELGGRGCDLIEWLIFEEEYWRANAPLRVNQNGIFLLGPTLMEFGTPEQKQHFLPAIASGDMVFAQAWSEPDAGSDLAAIRSTAVLDGDDYVVNGQKIWSTRAVFADWAFGIFRTDSKSTRHHGLTFILFDLKAPGITIRPIAQLNGLPGFAEIFFDNVRIPVSNRIHAEGAGWHVAMATAGFERGLMLRSPARFQKTAADLVALYRQHAPNLPQNTGLTQAVTKAWLDAESYALTTYRTASKLLNGYKIGAETSTNKIFWSELDIRMHELALSILGQEGDCIDSSVNPEAARWIDGYFFAQAGPIYAGTNEIQRNIIAERLLGMPR